MTEQERPRTPERAYGNGYRDGLALGVREGRQQAVREAKQQLKDADGPVEFQSAVWYSEVEGILDRVAGLNASESPPTSERAATLLMKWDRDPSDVTMAEVRTFLARLAGDASESGQPQEPER